MVLFHSRFHFVVYSSRSCISPSSEYVVTCSPVNSAHTFQTSMHSSITSRHPLDLVTHWTKYYEFILRAIFTSLGSRHTHVKTDVRTEAPTTSSHGSTIWITTSSARSRQSTMLKRQGSEVVKQVESPLLSRLIYPELQALDE
ncbi:hypothetical protein EV363DRAFT_1333317 [Boletus edulis]|nr:hypothetical protein EV363DRAFT_1333317 [Boletus edulis]